MAAKKKPAPKKATKKVTKKQEEANIPLDQLKEAVEEINDNPPEAPAEGQVQVNVDFLRTTKVHIAMPCYGGMLTESTFMSRLAQKFDSCAAPTDPSDSITG